jgi:ferric-dicitrate binding protein FerR (iron transport regulator)
VQSPGASTRRRPPISFDAAARLAADPRHRAAYQQLLDVDERASAVLDDPELQAATARDLELLTPASARRCRWPWLLLAAMLVAAIGYAVHHLLVQ